MTPIGANGLLAVDWAALPRPIDDGAAEHLTGADAPWSFALRPLGAADAMIVAALHQATLAENWSAKSIVDIVAQPDHHVHALIARLHVPELSR